jgi:Hypothetical glycosyl hydrolase 6
VVTPAAVLIGLGGAFLMTGVSAFAEEPDDIIKAFCVDFNWGPGGDNAFAGPGHWADASPEAHVAWYQALGANTIQTFAVSCNGYAWYKNGIVPEQPGLKYDFLTEVVKLGHARGMRVMAYFCVAANTRWSKAHPEQSYGADADWNLVMTDEYLDFLADSIRDAITKTGIDGFMIDWLWNPDRARERLGGKWIDSEKKLYEQVTGQPFAGEDKLTAEEKLAYDRKNIDRAWRRIRDAAKSVKPDCIIWLSCYDVAHPSVAGSSLFQEVDWLMNEDPDPRHLDKVLGEKRPKHQRVLQCVVGWGDKHDAQAVVTDESLAVRDFYGFAAPGDTSLPRPVEEYLANPAAHFSGNDRNIATLARYYNGLPADGDAAALPATSP